jgi:nucleoid-associated protein YgaU
MKMKEAQLLGILAIIAGGIIILSMWGSKPEPRQPADQTDTVETSSTEDVSESTSEIGEEVALDEWDWLTENEDEQEAPVEEESPDTSDEDSGVATLQVEGDLPPVSMQEFGAGDSREHQTELPEETARQLEEEEPENIPLIEEIPEDETAAASRTQKPEVYKVEKGDTLSAISREFYGTSAQWRKILEANREVLQKPEELRPGMNLLIPDGTEETPRAARSAQEDKPLLAGQDGDEQDGPRYHKVKRNDTLWSLAEKFYGSGKEYKKILRANEDLISDPSDLEREMRLVIPE